MSEDVMVRRFYALFILIYAFRHLCFEQLFINVYDSGSGIWSTYARRLTATII